ncbi:hypothetical protein FRC08_003475 [Ceratobasidium sp. 394]|nr:hypothetical protein FRC08_003475 [Ceratobasidium sp. 394]
MSVPHLSRLTIRGSASSQAFVSEQHVRTAFTLVDHLSLCLVSVFREWTHRHTASILVQTSHSFLVLANNEATTLKLLTTCHPLYILLLSHQPVVCEQLIVSASV